MREDWQLIRLDEYLDIQGGSQPPKSNFIYEPKRGYIQLLQIRDFGQKPVPTYVPINMVTKFCEENDVLIARYGASLGRIVTGLKGAYNVALAKVIDNQELFIKKYLFYLLQTSVLQKPLKLISRTAQNGFAKHEIGHIQLPLCSLLEQKAIVAKIEQLFSELDNGIANLKTAQAKLKIYRQAVLKKAFEGELTKEWREKQTNLPSADELLEQIKKEREIYYKQQLEEWKQAIKEWEENGEQGTKPKKPQPYKPMIDEDNETNALNTVLPENWAYHKLGEIYEVYIGSTPSRKMPSYWNGNINWVSSGEVAFKNIIKTEETITEDGLNNASTNVHPVGTVMLAMIGEGKTRGQAAILEIEACHNQNTAALRVNQNCLSSKLLYNFFYYTYQETRRIGSGNNQKALNKNRISNMLMPLMSFEEQKVIVQEIESKLSVCDKIEETIETSLAKSEALRQSILKIAFEGKLLSVQELENIKNHPEYESAEALLTRIKKEKNK